MGRAVEGGGRGSSSLGGQLCKADPVRRTTPGLLSDCAGAARHREDGGRLQCIRDVLHVLVRAECMG
ncbi:hypothetical protein MTO96_005795 [Rhipicephalus appendiculatus]